MATFVFKNAYLQVNGVDLSDHVRSISLSYSADEVEDVNMGDSTKVRLAGLKDWSLQVEFSQDFGSGKVDATLFDLVGAAPFAVHVKPVNAAISATNPDFTGDVILTEYPILDGSVGDLATTSVNFVAAGDLTRDVEP